MTVYRYQVTHVDYWRGNAHRWHSTFHYDLSSDSDAVNCIPDMYSKLQAMGPVGSGVGGIAEIAVYNTVTKGVPVGSTVYFPWNTPTSWIPYTGTGWSGSLGPSNGEAAARFKTQAGFSKSGKPVFVGLFWHAFKATTNDLTNAVQFSAADVTAMSALYNALQVLKVGGVATAVQVTPTGRAIAGSGTLLPYVMAHQRTRGRRRIPASGSSGLAAKLKSAEEQLEYVLSTSGLSPSQPGGGE